MSTPCFFVDERRFTPLSWVLGCLSTSFPSNIIVMGSFILMQFRLAHWYLKRVNKELMGKKCCLCVYEAFHSQHLVFTLTFWQRTEVIRDELLSNHLSAHLAQSTFSLSSSPPSALCESNFFLNIPHVQAYFSPICCFSFTGMDLQAHWEPWIQEHVLLSASSSQAKWNSTQQWECFLFFSLCWAWFTPLACFKATYQGQPHLGVI